jgi:H+/Cl- antiporter ClcA
MATEVQHYSEQSVTSLVSGIVSDFQDLVKQQLRMTRQEIETELRKSKESVLLLAAGWLICLLGGFALCLMLAHLLHWLGGPAGMDLSSLPLWACFALVGSLLLIGGGAMLLVGKKKMEAIGTPMHETVQALKENIEWKTNKRPS